MEKQEEHQSSHMHAAALVSDSSLVRTICPACGRSDAIEIRYKGPKVAECSCGLFFVTELFGQKEDVFHDEETVKIHDRYRGSLEKSAKNRWATLMRYFPQERGASLLDVGCGNGYFLKVARDSGLQCLGVEINQAAAEYAAANFGLTVHTIVPSRYVHALGQMFDIVTLWGVIEHLVDPNEMISAIRPFIRSGGLLVVQTPSEDATVRKLVHKTNEILATELGASLLYTNKIGGHIQCFSGKSISVFLERHGFQIVRIHDSTYGLRYMLKKSTPHGRFRQLVASMLGVGAYSLGFLGHKNPMTVYARVR
jgi:SAM-dependent methyltransferase